MNDKKQEILKAVQEYVSEQAAAKTWRAGEDWVQYSGPFFNSDEYVNAIDSLLNGWFILGEKGREFERKFAPLLGKSDGVIVN